MFHSMEKNEGSFLLNIKTSDGQQNKMKDIYNFTMQNINQETARNFRQKRANYFAVGVLADEEVLAGAGTN